MQSQKLTYRTARTCVGRLNLSPFAAREVDWLYDEDELADLPAEDASMYTIVWLPVNPDRRAVRHLLMAGMRIAEKKLAEMERLGHWNNPMWQYPQHARERSLALDEVARTAVFGGRLSWRTRRRRNQTEWLGRYYGWVHKVALADHKGALSTWVAKRTVYDMSDWFHDYLKHLNRGDMADNTTPDIATEVVDEYHLSAFRAAVSGLRNAQERQILQAALAADYDFFNPRKTPNFLPRYATEHDLSRSTANRSLRKALQHVTGKLQPSIDGPSPVPCQHPPGVTRCALCTRR